MNIYINRLVKPFILFLVYFTCFFSTTYVSWYNTFKYAAIVIIGLYIIIRFNELKKQKNSTMNLILFLFCIFTICISYMNRNQITERKIFFSSIIFAVSMIEMVLIVELFSADNDMEGFLRIFYKITIGLVFITDFLIIIDPSLVGRYKGNYFVGTKFRVAYLHMYLIAFMITANNVRNISFKKYSKKFALICIITIWISIKVDCNTGILGSILLIIICRLFNKVEKLMYNPLFFLTVLLASCSFMYIYESILGNAYVQHFITEVLGRSMTLTGRTGIYDKLPNIFKNHLIYGYGYGSSYEICKKFTGAADSQNGLAEWVIQIGIPGTFLMIIMFYIAFYNLNQIKRKAVMFPILAIIYVFSILASVEITISQAYMLWIIFIYGFKQQEFNNR